MMPTTRNERGAVATIFAVLIIGGVMLGLLAISIDVGNLMWERRQLQNAADAASLSLAKSCAEGTCAPSVNGLDALVNQNSKDGASGYTSQYSGTGQCGVNVPGLDPCAPTSGGLADCPSVPSGLASDVPYVEVHTETRTNANSLTQIFAQAAGMNGNNVEAACARVAYGTPGGGEADLPLTFSACDWQHATGGTTGGGGSYYPSPVYNGANAYGYGGSGQPAWPQAAATPPAQNLGQEVILLAQNPPPPGNGNGGNQIPATPCPSWNGHVLPGGFGVLETQTSPVVDKCRFVEYTHHWMHTSTGNNISCNLDDLVGKVVNIPVFDCTNTTAPGVAPPVNGCDTGNGDNAYFHRAGYAAFYLSGYNMNVTGGIPNFRRSLVSGNKPCGNPNTCISGWFVTGELNASAVSGPPTGQGYFGAYAIVPVG